jgi:hypothetical protein
MTDGALKIAYSALLKEGIELSRAHLSSKERMNEEVD